jgi:uncharacterized protein (TIGR03435 family)
MTLWTHCFSFLAGAAALCAQTTPRFEVASVKLSPGCENNGGGGRKGGGAEAGSPERLDLKCRTLEGLIRMAYGEAPVEGGPGWINSDRYDILAKAESPQTPETMHGPMLRALLEDRFRLKIHGETKEVPVYILTVSKSGPKLRVAQEGKCVPKGPVRPAVRQPGVFPCGVFAPSPANDGVTMYGTTLENFCAQLSVVMDRRVSDRTGIAGLFDIHIETSPESRPAPTQDGVPNAPLRISMTDLLGSAILSAVQEAGLRLEPSRGPSEFQIVDRVERPSGN